MKRIRVANSLVMARRVLGGIHATHAKINNLTLCLSHKKKIRTAAVIVDVTYDHYDKHSAAFGYFLALMHGHTFSRIYGGKQS